MIGESAIENMEIVSNEVEVSRVTSVEEAVQISKKISSIGDLVLLSPACSSLDMFRNYIDRGDTYTRAVLDIAGIEH